MKNCTIIYNPESGHLKNKTVLDNLYNTLEKNGYSTTLIKTEKKGHATELMETIPHTDLAIIAGGDGTLNESITGNLKRKDKLLVAHLPFGTCNDVGTMLGYTKNYLRDVDMLLNGVEKNIDICKINDKPFVYVACFGSFVDVPYATPREMKIKYGRLAYIFYGLQRIQQSINIYDIKYKVNGEEHEGKYSFIFVTNSNRVAGVNDVYSDVKLDDNKFEVAFCTAKNKIEIVGIVTQLLTTDLDKIETIEYYKTNEIEIEFSEVPSYSWCIDGEEYTHNTNKFVFNITKEMNMLLPTRRVNKLFEIKEETFD